MTIDFIDFKVLERYFKKVVLVGFNKKNKYPTRVSVKHNGKKGMIAIDQIMIVDKIRIVKVYKSLTFSEIKRCKEVIKESFVD